MDRFLDMPDPPSYSEDDLAHCTKSGDYRPLLFEFYKYVGLLCNTVARIQQESTTIKGIPAIQYCVLIGLLNRCSRLMFANVALSNEGCFGETTSIIDRCICESAIKLTWLCRKGDEESFVRFLAGGLKTEIEFKERIKSNIQARGGTPLALEVRMLDSIDNHISSSGLSKEEVIQAKKLPDMASIIDTLDLDRLVYIVAQRIGSHHVHGTWPSLCLHYLDEDAGKLVPRDHDCETHVNQYVLVPLVVLDAVDAFAAFSCADAAACEVIKEFVGSIRTRIQHINVAVVGNDMQPVQT